MCIRDRYEQWCETHPITELPKWKRGENVRLVRTEEQYQAAAKLFCEGRRTICAGNWTAEYCAGLREEAFLAQLKAEKKEGWACYLHTTKDVPDGMVSVDHKTGRIEHLFVAADARGKGIGQKMLDDRLGVITEYGLIRRKDGQPLPVFQPEQEIGQGLEMM